MRASGSGVLGAEGAGLKHHLKDGRVWFADTAKPRGTSDCNRERAQPGKRRGRD
ncbi:hypothetical protein BDK88_2114 [Natrinema hispanicum]|uniref:Uncharacterized protein n=1 Tax=Natrinema hispanicum TaxID=392421 RepID=A0A482YBX1_9EURY|nr:hypothetical protein [Natrinema hispanicum]RZV10908.1 hypothetical protein BDK88_2114 [Natrinema hispanicum]